MSSLPSSIAWLSPAWRRSTVVVMGVLAIAAAAALCGWAIYLDLHGLIGRTAFGYAVLFAFVPVVPLAALLAWLDRLRPEPVGLLVIALLWGALGAAYLSLHINGWLARDVGDHFGATARSAVFVAPWVEETTKAAIVFVIVWWRRHDFNSMLAGVIYGGLTGIGFGFTENIVYYGQLFQRVNDYQGSQHLALHAVERLFLWRGVAAPFVHPMFTIMTGLGIGIAVRTRHTGVRIVAPVAGFCCAVLLHMSYNAAASLTPDRALTAVYLALLIPIVVWFVVVVLLVRRHECRVISARLRDYTASGWLPKEHVPFIASSQGRRLARRHVRSFDIRQRDTVRLYQQTGVDLGVVRDRLVRGVAGSSELRREYELVDRLRRLRGEVVLPPSHLAQTSRQLG